MSDLIPEGWKLLKFGDIANIHKGLTYATSNYSTREYGYPFITLKCIKKNGGFSKVGLKYYDGQYKSQHIVIEGDVVFANTDLTRDGDVVGSPILVPEIKNEKPSLISMDLSKVLPKEGMDKGFIYYWLNSSLVKRYMINFSAGSTVLHLNTDSVPSIPALVPPISEQQKIAAILTSVDEVVEKTQAQIDKLKDLKSGMMQELLTKGVGIKQGDKYEPHTEFKDSPVGRIPKSWEVRKLADLIGSLQGGVSVNGENHLKKHSEIGVLKVSAVFKGRFIPSEYKTITKEDEPRARVNPIKGTILFSRANTPELVGESGYIEESVSDLFLPDKLWMLTAKEPNSLDMRWLCYLLNSDKIRKMITDVATGSSSSMKNISKVSLLSLEFAMPSCKNEQVEISRILHSIDIKLNKTEQKLLRTSNLKKALMQDLLTGKVRVKVAEQV